MKLQMCRICLVEDVAMLPIARTPLQEIYEKLTAMKLETNTLRPLLVCYMCHARLLKCYHLRLNCLRSEEMFKQMLISDEIKFSKPKVVFNTNFLTIHPVNKMNIFDIVHEMDKAVFGNEEQIKTEATPTEDIVIKMEAENTSDAEQYSVLEIPDIDIKLEMDDGQDICTDAEEQSVLEIPVTNIKIEMDGGQDNFTDAEEYSVLGTADTGVKMEMDCGQDNFTGACAKRLFSTCTSSFEHSSSKLQKPASAETENKDELQTRKYHKTNNVIITSTLISEDKILDKLENTTKLQKMTGTSYDVIKQSTVCSDANTKPSRLDFSVKTNLETPIPTTTKRYNCDIYNKPFSRKGDLINHLSTHTGETPYKCDICNKQFSRHGHLVRHSGTHTSKRFFKCDICNKQYSRNDNLVRHLRTHTREKPCDVCIKKFSKNSTLLKHLSRHAGEIPYKCDCNEQFNSTLVKHLRTY